MHSHETAERSFFVSTTSKRAHGSKNCNVPKFATTRMQTVGCKRQIMTIVYRFVWGYEIGAGQSPKVGICRSMLLIEEARDGALGGMSRVGQIDGPCKCLL
jgi:hypothetical protein